MGKWSDAAGRFAVALLLGLGLLLPSLLAMQLNGHVFLGVAVMAAVAFTITLGERNRRWRLISIGMLLLGLVIFFVVASPDKLLSTLYAIYLKLSGQGAALPLYGQNCTVLLALVFGFLGASLSERSAGFFPALTVSMVVLTVIWVTGREDLAVYALPGIAALVALYAGSVHDEMPVKRVLPLASVLVLAAFLLIPSGGMGYEPLEKIAQDIRQTVRDYLFFPDQRTEFSLRAEGYYPLGSDQLGGKAEPTDHPVMEVLTGETVYLRGAVKDNYTGRMWLNTTGGRRHIYILPQNAAIRSNLFNMDLPKGELAKSSLLNEKSITVKMVSDSASTLFLPQRLRGLEMLSSGMVPRFNNASDIFITRDLATGDMYRVSAAVFKAGDAGLGTLVDACGGEEDPNATGIYQTYSQLPDHLQEQVYTLAQSMIVGANTPYEKALSIQTYLHRYYKYTLDPKPMQGNVDFVSGFLLRDKEGYCTYFASAMTVLCRMIGLPARYIEGYIARPNADGVAHVTGLDAHAWTEVYFAGFGWVTFDGTPPRERDNQNPPPPEEPEKPEPEPSDEPTDNSDDPPPEEEQEEPTPEPSPEPENQEQLDPPMPEDEDEEDKNHWWLLWLGIVLLAALAVFRVYWVIPENLAKRQKNADKEYSVWVQAVFDVLYLKKLKKLPGETLMDYALRLDETRAAGAEILPMAQILSHLRYSMHPVEEEYVVLTKNTYFALEKRMKKWQKMKLIAYRATTPKKKADYAARL